MIDASILSLGHVPGCQNPGHDGFSKTNITKIRPKAKFSNWKSYNKGTNDTIFYRLVGDKISPKNLLPTRTQPDKINIILYGILYQVLSVTSSTVTLESLDGKTAFTPLNTWLQQVEIVNYYQSQTSQLNLF